MAKLDTKKHISNNLDDTVSINRKGYTQLKLTCYKFIEYHIKANLACQYLNKLTKSYAVQWNRIPIPLQ